MTLPKRTADTMMDAIALSSPSGRMSKRARQAAERRLAIALFGLEGLVIERPKPTPAQRRERLLQRATELRQLAAKGMRPRAFIREAERVEAEANDIEIASQA